MWIIVDIKFMHRKLQDMKNSHFSCEMVNTIYGKQCLFFIGLRYKKNTLVILTICSLQTYPRLIYM